MSKKRKRKCTANLKANKEKNRLSRDTHQHEKAVDMLFLIYFAYVLFKYTLLAFFTYHPNLFTISKAFIVFLSLNFNSLTLVSHINFLLSQFH